MKILIEINITEADLQTLQAIDRINQTDFPVHKTTDFDAKFGPEVRLRLESTGLLDWEYDEFVKDTLYSVSSMGYRTLSAAIMSGVLRGDVTSPV